MNTSKLLFRLIFAGLICISGHKSAQAMESKKPSFAQQMFKFADTSWKKLTNSTISVANDTVTHVGEIYSDLEQNDPGFGKGLKGLVETMSTEASKYNVDNFFSGSAQESGIDNTATVGNEVYPHLKEQDPGFGKEVLGIVRDLHQEVKKFDFNKYISPVSSADVHISTANAGEAITPIQEESTTTEIVNIAPEINGEAAKFEPVVQEEASTQAIRVEEMKAEETVTSQEFQTIEANVEAFTTEVEAAKSEPVVQEEAPTQSIRVEEMKAEEAVTSQEFQTIEVNVEASTTEVEAAKSEPVVQEEAPAREQKDTTFKTEAVVFTQSKVEETKPLNREGLLANTVEEIKKQVENTEKTENATPKTDNITQETKDLAKDPKVRKEAKKLVDKFLENSLVSGTTGFVRDGFNGLGEMVIKVTPDSNLGKAGVVAVIIMAGTLVWYLKDTSGVKHSLGTLKKALTWKNLALLGFGALCVGNMYETRSIEPTAYAVCALAIGYGLWNAGSWCWNKFTKGTVAHKPNSANKTIYKELVKILGFAESSPKNCSTKRLREIKKAYTTDLFIVDILTKDNIDTLGKEITKSKSASNIATEALKKLAGEMKKQLQEGVGSQEQEIPSNSNVVNKPIYEELVKILGLAESSPKNCSTRRLREIKKAYTTDLLIVDILTKDNIDTLGKEITKSKSASNIATEALKKLAGEMKTKLLNKLSN